MKKLKRISETSRGGRRQVLLKKRQIREVCEAVHRETGYNFQWIFDELMEMFYEGYVFGVNTHDILYERITNKLEI